MKHMLLLEGRETRLYSFDAIGTVQLPSKRTHNQCAKKVQLVARPWRAVVGSGNDAPFPTIREKVDNMIVAA